MVRLALTMLAGLAACAPLDDDLGVAEHELTVCADGPTLQGIDVSSWQGTIDWDAVGRSGIAFAIVRIGDGTYHDREFERNWREARRVGLVRGAYQFFEPRTDPIVQANLVIDAVGRLGPGDLPVTIDVEAPSPGVSAATYTARIHAWVDRVTEGTGRRPIVYTGRYYWDPYVASSDFRDLPLWHAQYTSASCPNINDRWRRWTFWQYTSSGSIAGIGGRIDRDVFNGTRADLDTLAGHVADPDADGDGVPASRDCDDRNARRFPGNRETCDGIDNDCQGGVDEDLHRDCGTDVGECVHGTETCDAGRWGACLGGVGPVAETCDGLDTDCDGETDEAQVCEIEEAGYEVALLGPDASSDVNGDGEADACARLGDHLQCLLGSEHGMHEVLVGPALGAREGWDDLAHALGLRMADLDGDGDADLCGVAGDHVVCWRSEAHGFGDPLTGPAIDAGATYLDLVDVDGDGAADLCTRDASGLDCARSSGHGFEARVHLDALSDAAGFEDVVHHGTLRFGDVDGDGRNDVCARSAEGVDCWLSQGTRFGERVRGPRWSDALGFDDVAYWATLRVVDVTGDGMADVCARTPSGFRCAVASERDGHVVFDAELVGPAMSDASGWSERDVYTSLRTGDVNGDGLIDVCAKERDRARCWLASPSGFGEVFLGPVLDARGGWERPEQARSLRLADVDGDGDADLCGRDASGLRCYLAGAGGFDELVLGPAFADTEGMSSPAAIASLRLSGGHAGGASIATLTGDMQCSAQPGRGRASAWLLLSLGLLGAALSRRQQR